MIKDLIKNLPKEERQKEKIKHFLKLTIDEIKGHKIKLSEERGLLRIDVEGIGKKSPIFIKNPPILVPDGTKKKIVDDFGNEMEIDNYKEDLEEVLISIVGGII